MTSAMYIGFIYFVYQNKYLIRINVEKASYEHY